MFGSGASSKAAKCKTQLRLVISRIKILRNKREIQVKHLRRDVAQLLENNQEGNARTRVEHAIREQNMVDAFTLIEGYCDFLQSRIGNISGKKECPPDLKEAIASLIYAGPRCADLPELLQVRSIFSAKYGKQFIATIVELRVGCGVSKKIVEKLSTQPLTAEMKLSFMREVAKEHNVNWRPTDLTLPPEAPETPPQMHQQHQKLQQQQHQQQKSPAKNQQSNSNDSPKSPLEKKPAAHVHPARDSRSDSDDDQTGAVPNPSTARPVAAPGHPQQYIPFVPTAAKVVPAISSSFSDPYEQYTKGIVNPYAQKASTSPPPPPPPPPADVYDEYQKKYFGGHAYVDVATAAEAAAQSADHAAAAARAAASLAHKHLSRESSMASEAETTGRSRMKRRESPELVLNLEDRVASYLRAHANDTDSSEWETPTPLGRQDSSPTLIPSRDLRGEAEFLENRRKPSPTGQVGDKELQRQRPTISVDDEEETRSTFAPKKMEAQQQPSDTRHRRFGHEDEDDNSLFRRESSEKKWSPLGKPAFDHFDDANGDRSSTFHSADTVWRYDGDKQVPPSYDKANLKPVFDEAPPDPPVISPRAPAFSRIDTYDSNMEALEENVLSRTEKLFEREDSDHLLSSPPRRSTRPARRPNFHTSFDADDDSRGDDDEHSSKNESKDPAPSSTASTYQWQSKPPPTRPPPKLVDSSAKHLDFQNKLHSAGVDYSEQPPPPPPLASVRRHRLGGASVRTKRA